MAETARRMRLLKALIKEWLVTDDMLGLIPVKPIDLSTLAQKRQYQFLTDDKKVEQFNTWLQGMVDSRILETGKKGETAWTAQYINAAYRKGMVTAYTAANRFGAVTDPDTFQGSQREFLRESFAAPESITKIRLLGTRTFEGMKGVTETMKTQLNRSLAQGIAEGRGVRSIAGEMYESIDKLTRSRALTIARTEIIYAHAEGQLDAMTKLGIEETEAAVEWSTAGDDRVCPRCAAMEGKTFKVKDSHGKIPLHPNCRCSWIPVIDSKAARKSQNTDREERRSALKDRVAAFRRKNKPQEMFS